MQTFRVGDSQAVLVFLEEIVELLAADNYVDAFSLFGEHAHFKFTPDELRNAIASFSEDASPAVVTSAHCAANLHPNKRRSLEYEDEEFVSVVHATFPYCVCWSKEADRLVGNYAQADLPLNGTWSDVTIKFDIEGKGDDCWLVLEDVEIM